MDSPAFCERIIIAVSHGRRLPPALPLLAWLALLPAAGCATRVVPPAQVADPQTVYVADYGHHASLVLPRESHGYAEFAFGEWGWFALGRQGWYRALPILTLSSPGTIGVRDISIPHGRAHLERELPVEHLHELRVERSAARELRTRFDEHFVTHAAELVYNRDLDMRFVPYPMRYSLVWQCNSMLADWLRQLGCQVRGPALLAEFEIAPPGASTQPPQRPPG